MTPREILRRKHRLVEFLSPTGHSLRIQTFRRIEVILSHLSKLGLLSSIKISSNPLFMSTETCVLLDRDLVELHPSRSSHICNGSSVVLLLDRDLVEFHPSRSFHICNGSSYALLLDRDLVEFHPSRPSTSASGSSRRPRRG